MSQRGIRIDDWFTKICLGVFFFCIGAIFLSIVIGVDLTALAEDPIGAIIFMLIPTVFMDIGLFIAIEGWTGRKAAGVDPARFAAEVQAGLSADGGMTAEQQKIIKTASKGISTYMVISKWVQRIVGFAAALVAIFALAYVWLSSISDIASGKSALKGGFFLVLGLVLVSYVIIIYLKLLRKPRAN